jgi:hypothetical protein
MNTEGTVGNVTRVTINGLTLEVVPARIEQSTEVANEPKIDATADTDYDDYWDAVDAYADEDDSLFEDDGQNRYAEDDFDM